MAEASVPDLHAFLRLKPSEPALPGINCTRYATERGTGGSKRYLQSA